MCLCPQVTHVTWDLGAPPLPELVLFHSPQLGLNPGWVVG